jgi:hypothetical protein
VIAEEETRQLVETVIKAEERGDMLSKGIITPHNLNYVDDRGSLKKCSGQCRSI